jgi:FkbM family methyltransferase
MPLSVGCHVIAVEALMPNAARALQTFAAAPATGAHGSWLERVHVFHNAVGSSRSDVTMRFYAPNPGGSYVVTSGDRNDTVTVASVVMDDLFFALPPAQRPRVRLGDGSVVAVEARHVYLVKVDVEGMDLHAMHGLRRLLSQPQPPAAVTLEFFPRSGSRGCDAVGFVRFMYTCGYVYEDGSTEEAMVSRVQYSLAHETAVDRYEGWWRLNRALP